MTSRAERTPEVDELRTISGFYPTPGKVIDLMISRVGPFESGDRVLEPSAGKGDIVDRVVAFGVRPAVVEPEQPCFADVPLSLSEHRRRADDEFPNAVYGFDHGLCLPIFPTLRKDQVGFIADSIAAFYEAEPK